ncbi:MAG: 20S proteasome subunit beta 1, PSMB6 [Amphiamblys sp. WSBS2006]|nr:MAG: 20S proteasome subunit beta 1, PSMB6 [Amphiamblys sp. WSBS2006]
MALKENEVSLGTTIMAVEYEGGVVIGADSRTTLGAYIGNRVSDKLTPLHGRIFCCRSGSAADTQAVADIVRYQLSLYGVQLGESPSVECAAKMVRRLCYDYKEQLTAGMIVAGWDTEGGGRVYSVPLGGSLHRQPFSIGGSGSSYIYGYCDSHFRSGMSRDACVDFVKSAVALAMARDGSSGGVIRVAVLSRDSVERMTFSGREIPVCFE